MAMRIYTGFVQSPICHWCDHTCSIHKLPSHRKVASVSIKVTHTHSSWFHLSTCTIINVQLVQSQLLHKIRSCMKMAFVSLKN